MRVFVAVELDTPVLAAVQDTVNSLRRRIGETLGARWVAPVSMHLTVRFIGHVADDRVPPILDALSPPLELAPFDVALGDCGVFPPHGPPRVLWIGVTDGRPSLHAMHEILNDRLLPFDFEPEERPYAPHLTVARVKNAPRRSGAAAREAVQAVRPSAVRCRISHATVFESRLSPRGPSYLALAHIPLRT